MQISRNQLFGGGAGGANIKEPIMFGGGAGGANIKEPIVWC